jgi:solute carrier family 25 (mitochondrial phosphate transporter), member 23/24/25/41
MREQAMNYRMTDAAIDMSIYHSLKATYAKSTGREEPGIFASLAFGAFSGAIGATSTPFVILENYLCGSFSSDP